MKMGKAKSEIEGLYTSEAIAKLFGCSARYVRELAVNGTIPVAEANSRCNYYDAVEVTRAYIKYIQEKGRDKSREFEALKNRKLEAEIALKDSQSELHKMKNEIVKGNYIAIQEIRVDYERFFMSFKKFAMSLPQRVVGQLTLAIEPVEARQIENNIQKDITRLLNSFVVSVQEEEKPVIRKKKAGRPRKNER